MTACVRVLSVQTVDSSPSILLVAPDGTKTLVNCGEGCQRTFLEFGQRISTVSRVCLTHLGHDSIGGLPGMILTTADVLRPAPQGGGHDNGGGSSIPMTSDAAADAAASDPNDDSLANNKRMTHSHKMLAGIGDEDGPLPGLDLIGPVGTQQFIRSLRHFMRRDSFQLDIKEGVYRQANNPPRTSMTQNSKSELIAGGP